MKEEILKKYIARSLILVIGFMAIGCTQYQINTELASCEGCHTDYAHLREVFSPDTVAAVGGCGGDAPHYEPYDRVFLGGDGYEKFKKTTHGQLSCTTCHGGVDGTYEKEVAHSGSFIKHPSEEYMQKCAGCHPDQTENFSTSLHNGTGQKWKVTLRSGLAGPEEFDQLPAHQIEGYNANCAHCHGTCGNCHVNRPESAGGGLQDGHNFTDDVSMTKTCGKCHVSRGIHAYLGVAPGTVPDVHYTEAGMECLDCHTGHELHGNGDSTLVQRYAYSELPECENCHDDIAESNTFHQKHIGDFNCQVCHSQDYNNCGSCHIHGDGARVPSYLGFKIAKNPIPDLKSDYDLVLVRRTLAAPDNWIEYGVEYSNFSVLPTYNYTTPHNIQRITVRTDVGSGSCSSMCHIRDEGGELVNKELYLFESDLIDWEIEATSGITVDGALPEGWFK